MKVKELAINLKSRNVILMNVGECYPKLGVSEPLIKDFEMGKLCAGLFCGQNVEKL